MSAELAQKKAFLGDLCRIGVSIGGPTQGKGPQLHLHRHVGPVSDTHVIQIGREQLYLPLVLRSF
jgi:hypothetical protein